MINHMFLPFIDFSKQSIFPKYHSWLMEWMHEREKDIENGELSSSICLQGILSELAIYHETKTDWSGLLNYYLKDSNGNPLAYSENYGKKLNNFSQWHQSPIHAIHTHWWIDSFFELKNRKDSQYAKQIQQMIQPNGWIYNPKVSNTNIRTRMKSELFMSLAMGLELLTHSDLLSKYKTKFQGSLSSVPFTGYVSAEYFRLLSLKILDSEELVPDQTSIIDTCRTGYGYCDFSVASKVDDYMGTAKRSSRDKAFHSAISSLQVRYIAASFDGKILETVDSMLATFATHLNEDPFDIPSFKMRDIDIPFGTDLSPYEIFSASYLLNSLHD